MGVRGNVVNLDSKIMMYLGTVFGPKNTKLNNHHDDFSQWTQTRVR